MALVGYHPSNSLKASQRTFFDVLYGFYTGPSPLLCPLLDLLSSLDHIDMDTEHTSPPVPLTLCRRQPTGLSLQFHQQDLPAGDNHHPIWNTFLRGHQFDRLPALTATGTHKVAFQLCFTHTGIIASTETPQTPQTVFTVKRLSRARS